LFFLAGGDKKANGLILAVETHLCRVPSNDKTGFNGSTTAFGGVVHEKSAPLTPALEIKAIDDKIAECDQSIRQAGKKQVVSRK